MLLPMMDTKSISSGSLAPLSSMKAKKADLTSPTPFGDAHLVTQIPALILAQLTYALTLADSRYLGYVAQKHLTLRSPDNSVRP